MEASNLRFFSLGIVIRDKLVNDDMIVVCPIESIDIQEDGLIEDQIQKYISNVKDIHGESFNSEIQSSNYLPAKWLPLGNSNRMSAPDVYKNETVLLLKFGDIEKYFWVSLLREKEIRRQETVLYAYSNIPSGLVPFDLNSSYWISIDTRSKSIKLHTSDNDKEKTTYDVSFNTKDGIFTIVDKQGNKLELKSVDGIYSVTVNTDVNVKAGNNVNVDAGNNINCKAGSTVNVVAGSKIYMQAPDIVLDGEVLITGNTTILKNTIIQKALTVMKGAMISYGLKVAGGIVSGPGPSAGGGGSGAKLQGPVEITGTITTTSPITLQGNVNITGSVSPPSGTVSGNITATGPLV